MREMEQHGVCELVSSATNAHKKDLQPGCFLLRTHQLASLAGHKFASVWLKVDDQYDSPKDSPDT